MNEFTDVTRKILNLSLAFAALCVGCGMILSVLQVRRVADAAVAYIEELHAAQAALEENTTRAANVISECALYAVATGLEEEHVLSATEAQSLRDEAVQRISAASERWGRVAGAVDHGLQRRRHAE